MNDNKVCFVKLIICSLFIFLVHTAQSLVDTIIINEIATLQMRVDNESYIYYEAYSNYGFLIWLLIDLLFIFVFFGKDLKKYIKNIK